ncbi:MAG: amidohydrolase [Actinobacteria bacterium]|nr:amidohydrolase [Actinomycetota bacterium]
MTNSDARAALFTGRLVRTDLDPSDPAALAEAMLVENGRITAIGSREEVPAPADAKRIDLGEGWAMPGLIEPHGHPSQAAVQLSPEIIDIRPVVVQSADEVWTRIRAAVAAQPDWVLANGWDPLIQRGLRTPTIQDLDALAGDIPLMIVHNSGHSLYFNTAAGRAAGVNRDTPDPAGAAYGRDDAGELNGTAFETAAVFRLAAPVMQSFTARIPELLAAHLSEMRRRGITTIADLTWQRDFDAVIRGMRAAGSLPVRVRSYEMSAPGTSATAPLQNGDAWLRQVGVKIWSDGSPWVGNIATSFPYLDTPATRALGLEPGHIGQANYSTQQIIDIGAQYAGEGWQLACHSHGDVAIDSTLDAFEELIGRFGLQDHRFRVEHCGLMTPAQFRRAAELGVTASLFVDHITYWGDVLVDDLFGERGAAWADAGAAFAAGHRATFHNDGTVTPCEPLRNMAVAETRTARSGRHLDGGTPAKRADTLRAHTANAAWQLRSEHEIGALRPGLFADLTVLNVDPRSAEPEALANARVLATAVDGVIEG